MQSIWYILQRYAFQHPPRDQQEEEGLAEALEPGNAHAGTVDGGRRLFLKGIGAAIAGTALSPLEGIAAEPKGPGSAEQPKDVVEKIGEGKWVIHRCEAEPSGEGMRGLSKIPTRAFVLEPITLTQTAELDANGGAIDQHYLLSLPRDIGDTARLKSNVQVTVTGMKDYAVALEMVTSQPHNNQFLSIHLTGETTGGPIFLTTKALSWMSHPLKSTAEGRAVVGAGVPPAIVQSAEGIMSSVHADLKYDASVGTLDPSQFNGRGDCGTFAQWVKQTTKGKFETIVGYYKGCIDQNGGTHAYNMSSDPAFLNFLFDGAGKRWGAQHGDYIATTVGTELNFPEGSPWAGLNGTYKSFNNFAFSGGNRPQNSKTVLSCPGQGVDGQVLANHKQWLDRKEAAELTKAHNLHIAERRKVAAGATDRKTAASK